MGQWLALVTNAFQELPGEPPVPIFPTQIGKVHVVDDDEARQLIVPGLWMLVAVLDEPQSLSPRGAVAVIALRGVFVTSIASFQALPAYTCMLDPRYLCLGDEMLIARRPDIDVVVLR